MAASAISPTSTHQFGERHNLAKAMGGRGCDEVERSGWDISKGRAISKAPMTWIF
jgi:hypothetical protein